MARWLNVLKEESQKGFHPALPKYGSGDPTSYGLIGSIVGAMSMCGAVRHGAEYFNFYVRRRGGVQLARSLSCSLSCSLPCPPPQRAPDTPQPPLAPSHDPRRPCALSHSCLPPPHPLTLPPFPPTSSRKDWIPTFWWCGTGWTAPWKTFREPGCALSA